MQPRVSSPPIHLRRVLPILFLLAAVVAPALAQDISRRPLRRIDHRPHGALQALRSCANTRFYLGDVVVETLVDQRYGDPWRWWGIGGVVSPPAEDGGGGPSDFTTTNNQEADVDELDLVKTDGTALYVAQDNQLHIVRSWPPQASTLLSSLRLPGYTEGLFLDGDRALVASNWSGEEIEPGRWVGTRLDLVDVADPAAPRIVRSLEVEGYMAGARKIGSRVFVVLNSNVNVPYEIWNLVWRDDLGLPDIDWDASQEEREAAAKVARQILRPLVDAMLAELSLRDLLPLLRIATPDDRPHVGSLLDCSDLFRPAETASLALLSVLTFDLDTFDDEPDVKTVGVLSDGFTVYASSRSLYVAQPGFWWWWGWGDWDLETTIHRFELSQHPFLPVRYAATGTVPGFILDQFSMGEHDGYLRVASTEFDWWLGTMEDDPGSRVTILRDDRRGNLAEVGHVGGIAPGERIFASRLLGDKGYLVTFRQIDPLFTLDLSRPTSPRVVGELEMPGFSAYLHPIGDDYLLAVGRAGRADGTIEGLAVNLFDVRDFAKPALAFQHVPDASKDGWTTSEALHDHHAFTFHRNVLSIPAYSWNNGKSFNGLLVFLVDPQRGIQELGRIDHTALGGVNTRMRRSVYIEDNVYSISNRGIKVNELMRPDELIAEIPFP